MKKRKPVESKIPTTKTNTNRKKAASNSDDSENTMAFSILKKNEFALILFGALLLTLIIFFVFFQKPDKDNAQNNTPTTQGQPLKTENLTTENLTDAASVPSASFNDLERRIKKLEQALIDAQVETVTNNNDPIRERVNRLETAFDVKFTTLIERMDSLEKKIANIKVPAKPVASTKKVSPKSTSTSKPPAKTTSKAPMFHTVKKGETLYSIGRKYKISVAALQKLNGLKADSKIYPGMNLLIR